MANRRVSVFGPAYLDRVLRVDQPLVDPAHELPLDQSVDGSWKFGTGSSLELVDPAGSTIAIELPTDWPGPRGSIRLTRPISPGASAKRLVRALSWQDDLGGMGAGYAAALGGRLVSALGSESDPTSRAISGRLTDLGIFHEPVRVFDHPADWTLLVTSGAFGDKLPIGFRGCHTALGPGAFSVSACRPCDLRVVASIPNRVASEVLAQAGAGLSFFAPAMRNVLDRDCPLSSFCRSIDVLSCNRHEWEKLDDREEIAWQVSILVVTDGSAGSSVRYTSIAGESRQLQMAAFPRRHPPLDTNRAGEAYGATLLSTLVDHGWDAASGVIADELIEVAARRGAAAAALELDLTSFGFPDDQHIDRALQTGHVD
jgi:sugar/nucleoside kinase (ribokinase family)